MVQCCFLTSRYHFFSAYKGVDFFKRTVPLETKVFFPGTSATLKKYSPAARNKAKAARTIPVTVQMIFLCVLVN